MNVQLVCSYKSIKFVLRIRGFGMYGLNQLWVKVIWKNLSVQTCLNFFCHYSFQGWGSSGCKCLGNHLVWPFQGNRRNKDSKFIQSNSVYSRLISKLIILYCLKYPNDPRQEKFLTPATI